MPFGLKNAAATLQRAINKILSPYKNFAKSYIDHIIIFSDTWEEHRRHLDQVFTKLEEARLAVKLQKCEFGKVMVRVLGHEIGSCGYQADPDKLETIKDIVRPATKKGEKKA